MNLEKLQSQARKYDNTNYADFILDYAVEIYELNPEDRFILFKDLYVTAKFGDGSAANLIQDHAEEYGVPDSEIDNIKKNIRFDKNGEVTVYRGLDAYNDKKGSSFTLDKERAIWFSTRLKADNADAQLIELKVTIDDIIFYSNDRQEQEIFLTNESIGRCD